MRTCSSLTDIFSPKLSHIKTETKASYPAEEVGENLVGKPSSSGNVMNVHSRNLKVKEEPLAVKMEWTEFNDEVVNDANTHPVPESKFKGNSVKSVTIKSELDDSLVMKLLRKSEAKVLEAQEKLNKVKKEKEGCNKQARTHSVKNESGVD